MIELTVAFRFRSASRDEWAPITFHRWLPYLTNASLEYEQDGIVARLSVDRSCIADILASEDEDISNWMVVSANRTVVQATAHVSDELAQFIYDERDNRQQRHHGIKPGEPNYARLFDEYTALGERIESAAVELHRRLFSYARNRRGQYWLQLDDVEVDTIPVVRSPSFDWVRWCPGPNAITLHATLADHTRAITEAEWSAVQQFVSSSRNPPIDLQLLANAELLSERGHGRSAVVEAVSALEGALFRFANAPSVDALPPMVSARVPSDDLGRYVRHVGLTVSIGFILPLLFPQETLNDSDLALCRDIITLRQNIVHNQQRGVTDEWAMIAAVRRVVEVLRDHTAATPVA